MSTYESGTNAFGNLRAMFSKSMIKPEECKVIIEMPGERERHELVDAIRHSSVGPPMSAAAVGNYSGQWFGIQYELRARPDRANLVDRVARRIYGQSVHSQEWQDVRRATRREFERLAEAAIAAIGEI